ncbi:MAG: aspartate--tRNA ligase, partial [Clostridia bacterium]|nr:aspartate--tRNA ligase [Clostridia bacterium]
ARDFLVPSRLHKGSFYALPQSPQLYKQLSMVAGFDRYMQIARCFRDEDLRADRQPEFTQIDLEMSFVDMEDILSIGEGYIKRVFKDAVGVDVQTPIKRLTYADAMNRYGSDKPDTRFDMELFDLSDTVKNCGFGVFTGAISGGGSVRGITAKKAYSILTRKEIDKLTEFVRGIGAKGLAFARIADDGTIASSFAKFMTDEEMENIKKTAGAENGDVILIVGDTKTSLVLSVLGALRNEVASKLDIIPKDKYNFVWITEFPFFDWDEDLGQFVAMHHPFTAPMDECLEYLESDKAKVRAKAYDLVLNGTELSSGSIRITDPILQSRMFALLGMSDEEAYEKFGYLLDAFKYGAPPHGGMGIGLDRLVMTMLGCETLRDVIAYPKDKNASEPMTECPSVIAKDQLDELGITAEQPQE